jgi:hypothetical protein
MQIISVERWTFWAAVVLAGVGPIASPIIGSMIGAQNGNLYPGGLFAGPLFVLLLVTVAFGGSRDPSVRSIPASPPP